MNRETVSYIKHIINSEYVRIDILNVLLAGTVIVMSFLAFATGNTSTFSFAFFAGAALAFFNAFKAIKKKAILAVVVFLLMFCALICAGVFVLKFLVV